MKNFVIWISGIVIVLLMAVLIAGQQAGSNFEYQSTVTFDVSQDLLWQIINNVEAYKENKWGVASLDITEYQDSIILAWTENYNFGFKKQFTVLQKKSPQILELQVYDSRINLNGTVKFELIETDSRTFLKVTEKTTVPNILFRGLKVLSGRESFVNAEIKWIRVGLYNYLINK